MSAEQFDAAAVAYPPEPWQLRGQLRASMFMVPFSEIPVDVPAECRLIRLGQLALVGAAWVSYEPGGVLSYEELMSTVLVRRGATVMATITHIWVDSPQSLAGGRALWGIPKDLATFSGADGAHAAADQVGQLATGIDAPARWLPGRWPVRFKVVQGLGAAAKVSPVRCRARIGVCRDAFDADRTGPLAFLSGRRPLVTLVMADFRMAFGGA